MKRLMVNKDHFNEEEEGFALPSPVQARLFGFVSVITTENCSTPFLPHQISGNCSWGKLTDVVAPLLLWQMLDLTSRHLDEKVSRCLAVCVWVLYGNSTVCLRNSSPPLLSFKSCGWCMYSWKFSCVSVLGPFTQAKNVQFWSLFLLYKHLKQEWQL